jgi:hypothetical protein
MEAMIGAFLWGKMSYVQTASTLLPSGSIRNAAK